MAMGTPRNPLFEALSTEIPSILTVSFASEPGASLGVALSSHDNNLTNEMFSPGFASVASLLDDHDNLSGEQDSDCDRQTSLARRAGVKVGDYIVAVNGEGFRRFPPDFKDEDLPNLTEGQQNAVTADLISFADEHENDSREKSDVLLKQRLKARVVTGKKPGESYNLLLMKIRQVKTASLTSASATCSASPLFLSMERYSWDSRVHSWSRFLSARNGNVPLAMTMLQAHERWRNTFFPIDLTHPNLQMVLKAHAVSEISVGTEEGISAVVYIDFAKLQNLHCVDAMDATPRTGDTNGNNNSYDSTLADNVIKAFVVYTETLLSMAPDPRRPKTCQFVDLTGASLKQGFYAKFFKKLYATFEPNYPETLEKMVMYPVPKLMASAVNVMLNFVNENTRKKFIITDDLVVVCKELGWNITEIEHHCSGSVNAYMKKHLRHGLSFVFD